MTLEPADLNLFLTGGSSNTNPQLSLGGNVSSTKVNSNILNNLFRRITDSEASSGVTLYRCLAVKNTDSTDEARNVVFYMVYDTKSVDSLTLYSLAQAGKNTVETPIANEFTAPTGSNINFIAALNRSGGLKLGHLDTNEYRNVWIRYTVQPGSIPFTNDEFKMRIECDNPNATEPPGPTPEPDPDTGVNFQMAIVGDAPPNSTFEGILSRIRARGPEYVMFTGDNGYNDVPGWIDLVKKYIGTSKSTICFGNHDVDSSSKKNALLNAWSKTKTYFAVVNHAVGIISIEAGEDESVSSSSGSTQYNWVKDKLEEFHNNGAIEWIFVLNHYPIYGPNTHHSNESDVRDDYDPLFDRYGVDIVFQGHNHNMSMTKLLKYNSSSPGNPNTAGTDPNYSYRKSADNHGKLYITQGAGGRPLYDIDSSPSYVTWTYDSNYGYTFLDFSNNGKKITGKFYKKDDTSLKTFTLTHT